MATASQRARTPVALAAEKKLGPRAQLARSHTPHLLDPAVSAAKKRYDEGSTLMVETPARKTKSTRAYAPPPCSWLYAMAVDGQFFD